MEENQLISQQPPGSGQYYLTPSTLNMLGHNAEPNPDFDPDSSDEFKALVYGLLTNKPVSRVGDPDSDGSDSGLASADSDYK